MSQRQPLQNLSSCEVKLRLSGIAAGSEPSCWPPTAVPYSLPVLPSGLFWALPSLLLLRVTWAWLHV